MRLPGAIPHARRSQWRTATVDLQQDQFCCETPSQLRCPSGAPYSTLQGAALSAWLMSEDEERRQRPEGSKRALARGSDPTGGDLSRGELMRLSSRTPTRGGMRIRRIATLCFLLFMLIGAVAIEPARAGGHHGYYGHGWHGRPWHGGYYGHRRYYYYGHRPYYYWGGYPPYFYGPPPPIYFPPPAIYAPPPPVVYFPAPSFNFVFSWR